MEQINRRTRGVPEPQSPRININVTIPFLIDRAHIREAEISQRRWPCRDKRLQGNRFRYRPTAEQEPTPRIATGGHPTSGRPFLLNRLLKETYKIYNALAVACVSIINETGHRSTDPRPFEITWCSVCPCQRSSFE